jgi:ABC-2 type transport system permease protein
MTTVPEPPPAPLATATGTGPASASGVIHDIGYRRYDGPRLGRGYIWRSLFGQSLRAAYGIGRSARSKVLPMLLLGIMVLPALIIIVVMVLTDGTEQAVPYHHYAVSLQLVIAVFVAAQAPQLFARDLRFRTITLYFARPPTRSDYVSARYAALVAALVVLIGLPVVVLYVGGLLAELPFLDETADLARALVGVAVFALILASLGALVASLTPRRGFAVAGIITLLTVSFAIVATVQGIAEVEGADEVGAYAGLLSPVTLADGFQAAVLGLEPAAPFEPPGALGAAAFVLVTVAVVAGFFGLLLLRYRRYRA